MKKLMFMATIAIVLTVFNACTKEEQPERKELHGLEQSKSIPEFGNFREEIIVYDNSKENSLLIALYADEDQYIKEYLKNFKLELVISPDWNNTILKSGKLTEKELPLEIPEIPQLAIKQKVTVEFLAYNLKDNNSYSLSVVRNKLESESLLKSGNFFPGVYTDFVTTNNFLGVVHKGYGWDGNNYDLLTYFNKKDCWLFCGWDLIATKLLIGDSNYDYYGYVQDYQDSFYKLAVGVYFDSRETDGACLFITDLKENFRGQNCTIGTYDTSNCYVGQAPAGTTAFIWANSFYYTPINGNQCPLTGSSFDSVNCYVMPIPTSCQPFVYANNWYVKPDRILN